MTELNAIGADDFDSTPPRRLTLSVLIPAFNDLHKLTRCLTSLQRYALFSDVQYLVQDDASPNIDMTAHVSPRVADVQRNAENVGFIRNVNIGAKRAAGDILFLCNHDVFAVERLSQDWDAALIAAFDNPEVGLVGAKLLFPNGAIQSAGGLFDALGNPFHRCLGYGNPFYEEVNTPRYVSWCTGGALAIRKSLWDALGGFDESYLRAYFDDVDLCARARLSGAKVFYEPRVTFIHEVGSTGGIAAEIFRHNMNLFKSRYVDTKLVQPDVSYISSQRFW